MAHLKTQHYSHMFIVVAILFISPLSPFNLCGSLNVDARRLKIFKLREGLKLSFYNTDADSLDLPTLDAYEPVDSSFLIASPPINHDVNPPKIAPTPSPYSNTRVSDPPVYGSFPNHQSPVPPPQFGPTGSMSPEPAPRPAEAPRHEGPSYAVWCVARPTIPEAQIQIAMDYACGAGADCKPVQPNGPCFVPNTLVAHASYAFNSYWQRTKIVGGTCDFGGTAILITVDPSYKGCRFVYI